MTANHQVWQRADALDRLGGDEDLLRELCQIFLEESPKLLQKLQEGVVEGDPEAVADAAHGFKGELSYLGAANASQAANQLEEMGRDRNLAQARDVLATLEKELTSLRLCMTHPADVPQ